MKVHFIDVGQGDSILIQVNDKNMLIDCGPREGKDNLFNYLNKLNIKTLDYVIATHPHADHIGNMADIINKYDVKKFYSPKVQTSTKTYEKMVAMQQSQLEAIPGVGKAKAKALFLHFKSIDKIRKATKEELCAVKGINPPLADKILQWFEEN